MIADWCRELAGFPESVWIAYAHSREPLRRLVTSEDYANHFHAAAKTCNETTQKLGDHDNFHNADSGIFRKFFILTGKTELISHLCSVKEEISKNSYCDRNDNSQMYTCSGNQYRELCSICQLIGGSTGFRVTDHVI